MKCPPERDTKVFTWPFKKVRITLLTHESSGMRWFSLESLAEEATFSPEIMLATCADNSMRYVKNKNKRYMVWAATSPKSKSYLDHFARSEEIIEANRYVMESLLDFDGVGDEAKLDFFDVIGEIGWLANALELPTSWFIEKAKPGSTPLYNDAFYSEARRIGERERIRNSSIQKNLIASGQASAECYKPNLLMMDNMDSQRFLKIFALVAYLVKQDKELAGKVWDCIPPLIRKGFKGIKRGGNSFHRLKKKRGTIISPSEGFIHYLKSAGFSKDDLAKWIKKSEKDEMNEQEIAWENMAYIFVQVAYTIERALAGWIKYGFASEAKFDEITAQVVEALCLSLPKDGNDNSDTAFARILDLFCGEDQKLMDEIYSPLYNLVLEIQEKFSEGGVHAKMIRFGEKADREGKHPPPEGVHTPYRDASDEESLPFGILRLSPSQPLKNMDELTAHVIKVMNKMFPLCEQQFHSIQMDPFLRREESWEWTQEEAIAYLRQVAEKGGNILLIKEALVRTEALVTQIPLFASPYQFYYLLDQLDRTGILFPPPKNKQIPLSGMRLKDNTLSEIERIRIQMLIKIMAAPSYGCSELDFPYKEGACSEMKRLRAMELLREMAAALNCIPSLREALENSGVMGALRRDYPVGDISKFDQTGFSIEPLSPFAQRVAQITHLRDKLEELMKHTKYDKEINRWGVQCKDSNGETRNELREALNIKIVNTQEVLLDRLCATKKDKIGQEEYAEAKTPEEDLIDRMEETLIKPLTQHPELLNTLKDFFDRLKACLRLNGVNINPLPERPGFRHNGSSF